MNGFDIALSLLNIVTQAAPGLLAAITGQQSDIEAIEAAREAVKAIPSRPASSTLDNYEAGR